MTRGIHLLLATAIVLASATPALANFMKCKRTCVQKTKMGTMKCHQYCRKSPKAFERGGSYQKDKAAGERYKTYFGTNTCLRVSPASPSNYKKWTDVLHRRKMLKRGITSCENVIKNRHWKRASRKAVAGLGKVGNGEKPGSYNYVPSKAEGKKLLKKLIKMAPKKLKAYKKELKMMQDKGIISKALSEKSKDPTVKKRRAAAERRRRGPSAAMKQCCRACGGTFVGEACARVKNSCFNLRCRGL